MWLVKLQKYFANTITFHLKNTLLLWIGHLYQEVKCKTFGQEEFTVVCYYGLSYVKQHMYTTVGAHRHVNWQILSDSYQMVNVLLACFCFCRGVYSISHGGLTSFTAPPSLAKIFSLGTHQHLRHFPVLLVIFHIKSKSNQINFFQAR